MTSHSTLTPPTTVLEKDYLQPKYKPNCLNCHVLSSPLRVRSHDAVVRCGEWDTQTKSEPLPHQDRGVAAIEFHPEFNHRFG